MTKWKQLDVGLIGQGRDDGYNLDITGECYDFGYFLNDKVNGICIRRLFDGHTKIGFCKSDMFSLPFIEINNDGDLCIYADSNNPDHSYEIKFSRDSDEIRFIENKTGYVNGIIYSQILGDVSLVKLNSNLNVIKRKDFKNIFPVKDTIIMNYLLKPAKFDAYVPFKSSSKGTYLFGKKSNYGLYCKEEDDGATLSFLNEYGFPSQASIKEINGVYEIIVEDQNGNGYVQLLFDRNQGALEISAHRNDIKLSTSIIVAKEGYIFVDGNVHGQHLILGMYDLERFSILSEKDGISLGDYTWYEDGEGSSINKKTATSNPAPTTVKVKEHVIKTSHSAPKTTAPSKRPNLVFDEIIGLQSFKDELEKIVAYRSKNGVSSIMNIYFYGEAGLGQSYAAERLAVKFNKLGYLEKTSVVTISAKDIINNNYEDLSVIDKALDDGKGGVILVKDIEKVLKTSDPTNSKTLNYFTKMMKKYSKTIFIYCSNEKDMPAVLGISNEFASRVPFRVKFTRYNADQYLLLAQKYWQEKGYYINKDGEALFKELIAKRSSQPNFGNLFTARGMFETIIIWQNSRTYAEDNYEITAEDIEKYMKSANIILNVGNSKELGEARKELNNLVGLKHIKEEADNLISFFANNKDKKGGFHMAFLGNPGTGKTEVARIIGKMLFEEGLLPTNKFIECTRSDLVGEYVGWTGPKTRSVIQRAMGGVLYIDEAYSLALGGTNDFGKEAIAELIKAMEDSRGDFCVILSGYTNEMNNLFNVNPGFKQRIKFTLNFPDYNKDELKDIAKFFLKKDRYEMNDDALDYFIALVEEEKKEKNFANARSIREHLARIEIAQSGRIERGDTNNRLLTKQDVIKVLGALKEVKSPTIAKKEAIFLDFDAIEAQQFELPFEPFYLAKDRIIESVVAIETDQGEGTGFFISPDGLIVTCNHVIANAKFIKVRVRIKHHEQTFSFNYDAEVVNVDKTNDLAIIKVNANKKFQYCSMFSLYSTPLEPLSTVILVGYPFGTQTFDNIALTQGKVSSYQVDQATGSEFINLDISAKRGNSGGCVIDEITGRVIGVLGGSKGLDLDGFIEEVNYCIPVKYVRNLIKKSAKVG